MALALLGFSLNIEAPGAPQLAPIKDEPHHRCAFENAYARVFRVSLGENDATPPRQQDVPYVFVALGPAKFVDIVTGKPAVHVVMTEGEISYSQGGFAHIIRTETGSSLDGVLIELL